MTQALSALETRNRVLVLVACSSSKLDTALLVRAKDLYTGPLFRKSRQYAEQHANMWGIISAKYGLLHPEALIGRYNVTVPPKGTLECLNLTTRISIQLVNRFGHPGSLVFWPKDITTVVLAGKQYVDLMPYYVNAQDPMKGLGIGQRLAWLNERIE